MKAYLAQLTEDQALSLHGIDCIEGVTFNPVLINGKHYISEEEVIECTSPELRWVRRLAITEVELELPNLSETNNENE